MDYLCKSHLFVCVLSACAHDNAHKHTYTYVTCTCHLLNFYQVSEMRTQVVQNGFCIVSPYISKPMMFCTRTYQERDSWVKVSEQNNQGKTKVLYVTLCGCGSRCACAAVTCLMWLLSQELRKSIMEEVDKRLSFGLAYSQLLSDPKIRSRLIVSIHSVDGMAQFNLLAGPVHNHMHGHLLYSGKF